jgi:hypothetical protein
MLIIIPSGFIYVDEVFTQPEKPLEFSSGFMNQKHKLKTLLFARIYFRNSINKSGGAEG